MKKEYVICKESLLQSVIADLFTFGVMLGSFGINHLFIGSKLIAGILLIMFLLWLYAKALSRTHTFSKKEDAINYLKELK